MHFNSIFRSDYVLIVGKFFFFGRRNPRACHTPLDDNVRTNSASTEPNGSKTTPYKPMFGPGVEGAYVIARSDDLVRGFCLRGDWRRPP